MPFSETWEQVALGLHELADVAKQVPALLFPVGIELYHWFFFRWRDGRSVAELDEASLGLAAELILRSVAAEPDCHSVAGDPRQALERFLLKSCDYRWTHLVMIEAELGRELARRRESVALAADLLQRSKEHVAAMVQMPYFLGRRWTSPYDMNYNEELYPSPGPVWPRGAAPIIPWLEENYQVFRSELDVIRGQPELFDELHRLERNAEGQDHAPEEDWTVVEFADTREEEPWKARICAHAPRSCELLRARPEFHCDHAAAYLNRMRPGARIKPHLGGPPRLVAHLGLVVPPDPIDLYVGAASLRWQEGRAHIIDDTYIHSAEHYGTAGAGEERYILHLLICHPCEPAQRALYRGLDGIRCS